MSWAQPDGQSDMPCTCAPGVGQGCALRRFRTISAVSDGVGHGGRTDHGTRAGGHSAYRTGYGAGRRRRGHQQSRPRRPLWARCVVTGQHANPRGAALTMADLLPGPWPQVDEDETVYGRITRAQASGRACVLCGQMFTTRAARAPVGRSVTGRQVLACFSHLGGRQGNRRPTRSRRRNRKRFGRLTAFLINAVRSAGQELLVSRHADR